METIELSKGYTAQIEIERDEHMGEPWKEHDGHGNVTEWVTRDKRPGERLLCSDRSQKRFYDYQGAIEKARAEGWDAPPYSTGTKGEQAVRAVNADFELLRAWCNDEWYWCGVIVTVCKNGVTIGTDSLWGIESCGDYWQEIGTDMAHGIMEQDLANRKSAWLGAMKESRERRACEYRGIATV